MCYDVTALEQRFFLFLDWHCDLSSFFQLSLFYAQILALAKYIKNVQDSLLESILL